MEHPTLKMIVYTPTPDSALRLQQAKAAFVAALEG
jgi:hypothetical protein